MFDIGPLLLAALSGAVAAAVLMVWFARRGRAAGDAGDAPTTEDIDHLKADLRFQAAELRRTQALLQAIAVNSPTKIHIKDVEGRYILINNHAARLFGNPDDPIGKTTHDLFPKAVADAFVAHDRAVIESGRAIEEEEVFETADGPVTYLTIKFPIYDLDGVAGVGAIGTDITRRKQAEEALLEREEQFRDFSQAASGRHVGNSPAATRKRMTSGAVTRQLWTRTNRSRISNTNISMRKGGPISGVSAACPFSVVGASTGDTGEPRRSSPNGSWRNESWRKARTVCARRWKA